MKKVLRLWVNGKGYEPFEYETFENISNELKERNISIGSNSEIGDNSRIGDNSVIGSNSVIGDNSVIGSNSVIGYNSAIGSNSRIGSNSEIGDNSRIGYNSVIGYNSEIGDNVKVKTLFFCGSNHSVYYWGEDKIQIGCQSFTISEWETNFKIIGIKHNYSGEQIKEYEYYINAIRQFHNHLNP